MFDRRRRLLAAFLVLPLWVGALVWAGIGAPPANAATVTTPTSCTNTAQAGTTALPITVTGSATPSSVAAGEAVTLSGATFGISVPGDVLVAGYRLGLLSLGANTIPATVQLTLIGANTTEGTSALPSLDVTGTTTISDPTPAVKNSGDESATPLAVTAPLPTSTWTAAGGDIALSLGQSSTTALVGPGGFIAVTFACTPGTPTPAGCGPAPLAACTGTNPVPAAPFTTVTVTGGSTSSSTSSTSSSTSSTSSSTSSTSSSTTSSSTTSTTVSTSTTSTTAPPVAPTKVTGTGAYTTTCKNSVTPDTSELQFAVTGSTMSPIDAGSTTSLTNQSWEVTVPASVLQTGINLGLLHAGDTPAGTAVVSVFASNTKEGTMTSAPLPLSIGPIALGSDGLALPAKTTFAVPDMSWTAVGSNVAYGMSGASVEVEVGPLKVQFTCVPKDPNVTIVTATVRGQTNIPAATKPGTEVLGTTVTSTTETLPKTGTSPVVPIALAVGLIDLGYLLATAAAPARRRLRYLVR